MGAGSGRDLANALLVREELRPELESVDLAGFLTPWAWHQILGSVERPVTLLSGPAKKYLLATPREDVRGFFEPLLPGLNERLGLAVGEIFLLSLQYGTAALGAALQELVHRKAYDTVIAVDVGGDILAEEQDRGGLLTPVVDFSCLDLLTELPGEVRTILAVVAPGTCGEVASERLLELRERFIAAGAVLETRPIEAGSPAFRTVTAVDSDLNRATGVASHTMEVLQATVRTVPRRTFNQEYARTYRLGERSWSAGFPVTIVPSLQALTLFLDPRRVRSLLRRPKLQFQSVLEAHLMLKMWGACGTELDCSFLACADKSHRVCDYVYALTPCCHFRGEIRRRLLHDLGSACAGGSIGPALHFVDDDAELREIGGLAGVDVGPQLRLVFPTGTPPAKSTAWARALEAIIAGVAAGDWAGDRAPSGGTGRWARD